MPRLHVLSDPEADRFDQPPVFNTVQRKKYFNITPPVRKLIQPLRKPYTQVGFVLQWGYFLYTTRFFSVDRFQDKDISYIIRLLGAGLSVAGFRTAYESSIVYYHRTIILEELGFHDFDGKKTEFNYELGRLVAKRLRPKQIFYQITQYLKARRIVLPSAHFLVNAITYAFRHFEDRLRDSLRENLWEADTTLLDALLEDMASEESRIYQISRLKKVNQNVQPSRIRASLEDFLYIKELFFRLLPIVQRLRFPEGALSEDIIHYHAQWTIRATTFQLQQISDPYMQYLHLLSFIHFQFYTYQDSLIEVVKASVQSSLNQAEREQKERYFASRRAKNRAIRGVTRSRRRYKLRWQEAKEIIQSEELADDEKVILLQELVVAELEEDLQIDQDAEALEKDISPVTQQREYYDIVEGNFRKLNNRVGRLLQLVVFDQRTSDPHIFDAWQYYVEKHGKVGGRAPMTFLDEDQRRYLYTEESNFRPALYRMLLFFHIAKGIKAGSLNASYSYRHRAVDDYFLLSGNWHDNHEQLLAQSELSEAKDGKAWLERIYDQLHEQFQTTNQRIQQEQNDYLRFAQGKPPTHQTIILHTPAVEKIDTESLSSLFADRRYTSVLEVLFEVHQTVGYLDCFQHYNLKYKKQRPLPELFIAAIIGYGCNVGIRKVARISKGISANQLENAANWYFSVENIQAANQRLVEMIDQVPLSEIYRKKETEMHTASDGQKFGIHGHSLNANHSFKYFGSGKSISVYSFADERSATFHSTVISSSEREAAYVIDGLLHNEVVKSTIHSTDTHGFSEIVFGVAHLLGYTFAPRIKNFKKSVLYSPLGRSVYQAQGFPIFPDRMINEDLILSQWDNILRLIATIVLRETTASQIFKRLSSYSLQHPLYQALKEYGRLIKTQFLLRYMDDIELRQAIERQLNIVELIHRFSRAVFFADNQEFSAETKEEQEVVAGCKQLIQNAIVLWNYLYLNQKLIKMTDLVEISEFMETVRNSSIVSWQHINMQGEYDFLSKNLREKESQFDLLRIMDFSL